MKIGQIGNGGWGKLILRDLLALGAEVHVAATSQATCDRSIAAGATSACIGLDGLPEVDGYVVVTPITRHFEVIKALIPSGKPIFCEKPVTADPAEMEVILKQAGERVFSMDKWRYHPGILKLAELARSGALGEVVAVSTYRLGLAKTPPDTNVVWHLAPHDLSIALEILGDLPMLKSANGIRASRKMESLSAVLQTGGEGVQVTLDVSSAHPVVRRSVIVIGTTGTAGLAASYDDHITVKRQGADAEKIPIGTEMPLLAELRAFLSHLDGGPAPKSSARDAGLIVRRLSEIQSMAGFS